MAEDVGLETAESDRGYIEELISDLLDRSKVAPEAVFTQLCNLSVGPLIADDLPGLDCLERAIREQYPELKRLR